MAIDNSLIYKKALDWQAKSVIDFSMYAGYGGGIKHLAIWSPSLKTGIQGVVLFAGFGAEAKAKIPKFDELLGGSYDFVKSFIENSAKFTEGSVKAAGQYSPVTVFRSFSLYDFSVSQVAQAEAGGAAVVGLKVDGLTVYCGLSPIFSIPPAIGASWGIGAGAQASVGTIVTTLQQQISTQRRFEAEKNRKSAADPLPRFPGGAMGG